MASILEAMAVVAYVHVACISDSLPPETLRWAKDHDISIEHHSQVRIEGIRLWIQRFVSTVTRNNLMRHQVLACFFNRALANSGAPVVWLEGPHLLRYALPWRNTHRIIVDYWGTSQGQERDFRNARARRRPWEWIRWQGFAGAERRYAPLVNDIVTVHDLDADYFRALVPGIPVVPIPLTITADTDDRIKVLIEEEAGLMIMTGNLSYRPNTDAAMYFADEILPIVRQAVPNARLLLVGQSPNPNMVALGKRSGVEVKGFVPDLQPEILRASVYVLPMRLGSGIRSKLFDLLPLGKALVTTSLGLEGMPLVDGESCLVADTADHFAKCCARLLMDGATRRRLGEAARVAGASLYSKETVIRGVKEVLYPPSTSRDAQRISLNGSA